MIHRLGDRAPFSDLQEFYGHLSQLPEADIEDELAARMRNRELTKPEGSLGHLEELAVWYNSWRPNTDPDKIRPQIVVFAGNHGVSKHGVSAFPSSVTAQMVKNFKSGGAAINQLAKVAGAQLDVVDIHLERPTADISCGPAMTEEDMVESLAIGWESVRHDCEPLILGEMGIGNTTSASAVCLSIFGRTAEIWTGPGTGVAKEALQKKIEVVKKAVKVNKVRIEGQVLKTLGNLGGREMVAIVGAIVRARHLKLPVLLDGFVCSTAAACLQHDVGEGLEHTRIGHLSGEPAHTLLVRDMGMRPLIHLAMRLGEASGAAVAYNLLHCALSCHAGMATFAEAGVAKE